MTRQQIHRTNQAKNDNSSAGGIFQRAAVHYVEAKELQQDEVSETRFFSESRFHHDFTKVPVNTESLPVIQPKLKIGAVGDKYEQEADRVARQVVSQVNASTGQGVQGEVAPQEEDEQLRMTPIVQRQLGTDTDETEQKIAKNQENNLISIDVNQYPANAGIIQRFKDPETDEEVNIAEIKYYGKVLDYLKLIQEKKLRVTTLQQPITRSDILTTFKLSEISNKSQELPVEIGRWETGLSHISLTWTNSSIKKTTIHNILDIFCKKYNLINRPELIPIFQKLNNKDVGAKTNFDVKQYDIFLFPLPSRISKFYNVAGGFQSVGSKILSEDKIKQLGGIT
jgi:hypothetical protein